jgi:hypothetical protein
MLISFIQNPTNYVCVCLSLSQKGFDKVWIIAPVATRKNCGANVWICCHRGGGGVLIDKHNCIS